MIKRLGMLLGILAVSGFLVGGLGNPWARAADDPKEEKPAGKTDPAGDDVRHIGLAHDLVAYGRSSKSPELLIAAARILRSIHTTAGTGKPEVEGDKEDKEPEAPVALSLTEESDKLLAEAKKLAPDDALIGDMADRVAKIKKRGALGGPRAHSGVIRPGVTHTWSVNFAGGRAANISVTGNGISTFTLDVVGPFGGQAKWIGLHPSLSWVPAVTKNYVVRVRNDGPSVATYTLYHN